MFMRKKLSGAKSYSDQLQKTFVPTGGSSGNGWTLSAGLAVWEVIILSRHHLWRQIFVTLSLFRGVHPFLGTKEKLGTLKDFAAQKPWSFAPLGML